ncbi:MAG UNVERIFIED_CONTAM: hypothetical protein LVR18_49295 [Planctomycetaceae bacterium]
MVTRRLTKSLRTKIARGDYAYYGENYPAMYEKDADFFVMNILEKDRDVFRQLLTSNEYYIINRATFRNTVYDFYKQNQQQLDAGEYPEAKQQELLRKIQPQRMARTESEVQPAQLQQRLRRQSRLRSEQIVQEPISAG